MEMYDEKADLPAYVPDCDVDLPCYESEKYGAPTPCSPEEAEERATKQLRDSHFGKAMIERIIKNCGAQEVLCNYMWRQLEGDDDIFGDGIIPKAVFGFTGIGEYPSAETLLDGDKWMLHLSPSFDLRPVPAPALQHKSALAYLAKALVGLIKCRPIWGKAVARSTLIKAGLEPWKAKEIVAAMSARAVRRNPGEACRLHWLARQRTAGDSYEDINIFLRPRRKCFVGEDLGIPCELVLVGQEYACGRLVNYRLAKAKKACQAKKG